MKRKNKSKWYKSKGGWIGAGIGLFTPYITEFFGFPILSQVGAGAGVNFMPLITLIIMGFLIGYFIQNKFFKRKR